MCDETKFMTDHDVLFEHPVIRVQYATWGSKAHKKCESRVKYITNIAPNWSVWERAKKLWPPFFFSSLQRQPTNQCPVRHSNHGTPWSGGKRIKHHEETRMKWSYVAENSASVSACPFLIEQVPAGWQQGGTGIWKKDLGSANFTGLTYLHNQAHVYI